MMEIRGFLYNKRGIDNNNSLNMLRNIILEQKPYFIFIAEPMTAFSPSHALFFDNLNFNLCIVTDNNQKTSKMWCLGRSDISVHVMHSCMQYISISVSAQGRMVNFAGIYGATTYNSRRTLWCNLSNLLGPQCLFGDFNVVLFVEETKRGILPNSISCIEFSNWTDSNDLIVTPSFGAFNSWSNARTGNQQIERKLDRTLCNILDIWSTCRYKFSPRIVQFITLFRLPVRTPIFLADLHLLGSSRCGFNTLIARTSLSILGLKEYLAAPCWCYKKSYRLSKLGISIYLVICMFLSLKSWSCWIQFSCS